MGEILEFDAYHGTSEEKAVSIARGQFRTATRIGWLGCGTYFYDSDYDIALQFANCLFSGCPVRVINCKITIDSDKVFDIVDPRKPDCKKFHKMKADTEEAIGAAHLNVRGHSHWKFEAQILEKICSKDGYTMVRACTYSNNKIERDAHLPLAASKFANGIELCVKDSTCIKNKKII